MAVKSRLPRIVWLSLAVALAFLPVLLPGAAAAQAPLPQVVTDKADYLPEETVTITGTGFASGTTYAVPVIRPDGSIVIGDGSFTLGWDTLVADKDGGFVYLYQLDGIEGVYEVRVYPASWTGDWSETPVASVTFTDFQYTLQGLIYGGDPTQDADWTNGNVCQGGGGCYEDGGNVPFRLKISDLNGGSAYDQLHIQHDYEDDNGIVGYEDFNSLVCTSGCSGSPTLVVLAPPPGDAVKTYAVTFTTSSGSDAVTLRWNARLGTQAHLWNGATLHARLVQGVDGEAIGNRTVPIQVNQIENPSIDVEKYVSVDGQVTWEDADSAPGPAVLEGEGVYFKFVVTNTGNVQLSNISLSDNDFDTSSCTVTDPLAVGGSFVCMIGPESAVVGQHTDTATAKGDRNEVTYDDSDDANYFGVATGSISGYKWNDFDADGVWDAGEPPLDGWIIVLFDQNAQVWPSTVTDADGYYEFTGLAPGTYQLWEGGLQFGWQQTWPVDPWLYTVELAGGQDATDKNFGNHALFSGYKWNDLNGDGVWDEGELPLNDWTIKLYGNEPVLDAVPDGLTELDSALTGDDAQGWPDGYYQLTLPQPDVALTLVEGQVPTPPTFTICEVLQDGWQQTAPGGTGCYEVSLLDGVLGLKASLSGSATVVRIPTEIELYNFGNQELASISGVKWHDLNGDGIHDAGEALLAGWTIELYQGTTFNASTVTAADGSYSFSDLLPDMEYTVREVLQAGWRQTAPAAPGTHVVTPTAGQAVTGLDFGNQQLGRLDVTKMVNWGGVVPDGTETFEICISGPSYPSGNCKTVSATVSVLGGTVSWDNLIPGEYLLSETPPAVPTTTPPQETGSLWTVVVSSDTDVIGTDDVEVVVPAAGGTATGSVENIWVAKAPPLAVDLVQWTSLGGSDSVAHTWATAWERGTAAFRLYRGSMADKAGAALVAEVGATGTANAGSNYAYTDGGLSAGTYYYWLVELIADGTEAQIAGPREVVVGGSAQAARVKVFIPISIRR